MHNKDVPTYTELIILFVNENLLSMTTPDTFLSILTYRQASEVTWVSHLRDQMARVEP